MTFKSLLTTFYIPKLVLTHHRVFTKSSIFFKTLHITVLVGYVFVFFRSSLPIFPSTWYLDRQRFSV